MKFKTTSFFSSDHLSSVHPLDYNPSYFNTKKELKYYKKIKLWDAYYIFSLEQLHHLCRFGIVYGKFDQLDGYHQIRQLTIPTSKYNDRVLCECENIGNFYTQFTDYIEYNENTVTTKFGEMSIHLISHNHHNHDVKSKHQLEYMSTDHPLFKINNLPEIDPSDNDPDSDDTLSKVVELFYKGNTMGDLYFTPSNLQYVDFENLHFPYLFSKINTTPSNFHKYLHSFNVIVGDIHYHFGIDNDTSFEYLEDRLILTHEEKKYTIIQLKA